MTVRALTLKIFLLLLFMEEGPKRVYCRQRSTLVEGSTRWPYEPKSWSNSGAIFLCGHARLPLMKYGWYIPGSVGATVWSVCDACRTTARWMERYRERQKHERAARLTSEKVRRKGTGGSFVLQLETTREPRTHRHSTPGESESEEGRRSMGKKKITVYRADTVELIRFSWENRFFFIISDIIFVPPIDVADVELC